MARDGAGDRGRAALGGGYGDEDEDEERVVYYDLDAGSGRRSLLLSPVAVSRPAAAGAATAKAREQPTSADGVGCGGAPSVLTRPKEIFRPQQPLFHLDDSGDEEEEEEENPFASLLQQQREEASQHAAAAESSSLETDAGRWRRPASTNEGPALRHSTPSSASTSESGATAGRHFSVKRKQPPRAPRDVLATGKGATKRLSFEAADSRPARWSTSKPSAVDTHNRRKSLSAIHKRRSQLAAAPTERRQSMPAASLGSQRPKARRSTLSTLNDNQSATPSSAKTRRLSDVLNRATLLSQQKAVAQEPGLSQQPALHKSREENPMDGDAILDTEVQMRAEPFDAQIFSPTKPLGSAATAAGGRKAKDDAGVSKVRGRVGDALRKALRKSQRDLTLLRSRGQHLLPQQNSRAASGAQVGAVESIQERPYVVVCTQRRQAFTPQSVVYACHVHEASKEVEEGHQSFFQARNSTPTLRLEALFPTQTAEYLKLVPGLLLKMYEPLHFVPQHAAAGFSSTPTAKWFLLGTQLAEVLEESHSCSGGTSQ